MLIEKNIMSEGNVSHIEENKTLFNRVNENQIKGVEVCKKMCSKQHFS